MRGDGWDGCLASERTRQAGLLMSLVEYLEKGQECKVVYVATDEVQGHGLIPTCLPTVPYQG